MTWWRLGKMLSHFYLSFIPLMLRMYVSTIHTHKWNMRLCLMLNIYMSDACSNTLLQVSVPKLGSRNIAYNGQSVSPLSPQQNDQQYQCNYINLRRVLHTGILGKGNLSPHHRRFKGCCKKSQYRGQRSNHMDTFMDIITPNLLMTFNQ